MSLMFSPYDFVGSIVCMRLLHYFHIAFYLNFGCFGYNQSTEVKTNDFHAYEWSDLRKEKNYYFYL